MRASQLAVVLSAAVTVAGCVAQTDKLPPAPLLPEAVRAVAVPRYYLQPGDTLSLRLLLNPELNEDVTVGADGHISTSAVSDEVAAGKTVPELRADLMRDYSKTISNPRISVEVKSFAPTRVFVGGEVGLPGQFETTGGPPLRLSQAIARAGGVKPSADTGRVFIIRAPSQGSVPQMFSTRYNDVTHAVDAKADVTLAPFDMVFVPKSAIAEVYTWYQQYVQQFVNPSFSFNYILNPGAGAGSVINNASPTTATTTNGGTR
jgi:polysaccharide export outer membrane protein